MGTPTLPVGLEPYFQSTDLEAFTNRKITAFYLVDLKKPISIQPGEDRSLHEVIGSEWISHLTSGSTNQKQAAMITVKQGQTPLKTWTEDQKVYSLEDLLDYIQTSLNRGHLMLVPKPADFSGIYCSILGADTYVSGRLGPEDTSFLASELTVGREVVLSKSPLTRVVSSDQRTFEGYLISQVADLATLSLPTGGNLTVKFISLQTDAYPRQSLLSPAPGQSYLLRYRNGLQTEILSEVQVRNNIYVVSQRLRITSHLATDLVKVRDLQISYQQPRSGLYGQSTRKGDSETLEDVTALISTGPLDRVPAQSTITMKPLPEVELITKGEFVDLDLTTPIPKSTVLLEVKAGILYPSDVKFRNDRQVIVASMPVPLKKRGGTFETSFGTSNSISLGELRIEATTYTWRVTSLSPNILTIRIGGYQLEGRVDTFTIHPKETKDLTGEIPTKSGSRYR